MEIAEFKRIALSWLSRRDYSELELYQRLEKQGASKVDIVSVISWCKEQNYLNEQRFVDMLLRSRVNKGYGFGYIVQECRAHNIGKEALLHSANELEIDWFACAKAQYEKKYGDKPITDYKDKLKRMAYMQRRGFSQEQTQFAINEIE